MWLGKNALTEFKFRAFTVTDVEYIAAYKALAGMYQSRRTDTTDNLRRWLLNHLGNGICLQWDVSPQRVRAGAMIGEEQYSARS